MVKGTIKRLGFFDVHFREFHAVNLNHFTKIDSLEDYLKKVKKD